MDNRLTENEAALARDEARRVISQVERVIVGKRETIELLMVALMARGHVLIEDIPGVGKTMLAKAMSRAIGGSFKRLQFTPDLLPGDVTGLSIYSQKTGEFLFHPGPVFANVVLADEINRATPKTQSALLESMEESQVTVEGTTRPLPQPFFVLATQNPLEYRGTYPLPEAQMDRFLMRVAMGYPGQQEEEEMLSRHAESGASSVESARQNPVVSPLSQVEAVLSVEAARNLQMQRARVFVAPEIRQYIVALMRATRGDAHVLLGASPRAALSLQRAAQSAAILAGRAFVSPDDVKKLVPIVLAHRLILREEPGAGTQAAQGVLDQIMSQVRVPGK